MFNVLHTIFDVENNFARKKSLLLTSIFTSRTTLFHIWLNFTSFRVRVERPLADVRCTGSHKRCVSGTVDIYPGKQLDRVVVISSKFVVLWRIIDFHWILKYADVRIRPVVTPSERVKRSTVIKIIVFSIRRANDNQYLLLYWYKICRKKRHNIKETKKKQAS